jgi:hypothetical protein
MEEDVKTKIIKVKPKPEVDKQIIEEAMNQNDTEKQVIVHCHFKSLPYDSYIRIWKTTYLRDKDSAHKSKLLTAHKITFFPIWMPLKSGRNAKFTLVFSSLPKNCTSFDLFEDIPEGGGFYTGIISRNKTDVYSVDILS